MKNAFDLLFIVLINLSILCINSIGLNRQNAFAFPNTSKVYSTSQFETKFLSNLSTSNIILPIIPLEAEGIEASAAVYLPDLDQYLTISDETPHNSAIVFLMDKYGRISREYTFPDVEEIIDMESMTIDENETIYIAASLSENSNNNIPEGRDLLITLQKNGTELVFNQSIDLLSVLSVCAENNEELPWAVFLLDAIEDGTLDLEAMFWQADALFLGFKTPLLNNQSIILKIDQVGNMLATEQLDSSQISIWKQFALNIEGGEQEIMTDILLKNNTLFITSVPENRDDGDFSGSLWQLELSSEDPIRIAHYDDLKPEGIAATDQADTLLICFDQGANQLSQTTLVKGIQ